MNRQRCGRMLFCSGIEVQMHGFVLTVGPTCAEKRGAVAPKKKRGPRSLAGGGPRRVARRDQLDLFGVAA